MTLLYALFGIKPEASSAELDAAFRAKMAAYDPALVTGWGTEFEQLACRRRTELIAAYHELRPALALPVRLDGAHERQRDRETIIMLLIFTALVLAVILLRNVAVPERTVAVTGQGAEVAEQQAQPATDFTLATLDGSLVSLSQYKGQVVLINFWATWCPPCVREMPSLVRVYEQYKGEGFVILGINTTYQDETAKVAQFVRDQGVSYPVLLDMTGESNAGYGSRLMPTSYLISRDGKIVYTHVGQLDERSLSERVAAELRRTPASE